jgi:uncharacterized protein
VPTFFKILLVLLTWNGALWLVIGWLVAPVLPGGRAGVMLGAILLLLPVLALARGFGGRAYPSAATRILVYRPFWYGQLFLPLLAGAGLLGMLVGWPFGMAATLGRWWLALAGVGLLLLALWGYLGARRLVIRPLALQFAALPPGLEGMRIAHLSDLHVGPHTSRRHLRRVVDAVRDARPDLIALTGDQVDDYPRDVEPLGRALGSIAAPLGVFAVPGNHDIYAGWPAVRRGLESLGWRVLVNAAVRLEREGSRFWIVGTGDPAAHSGFPGADATAAPDVQRALASVPPGEFAIALAHNPALWPQVAARGVQLTLSGHTHYGQFAIPRLRWSLASAFLEHAMDLHRHGPSTLYINPGTNFWGIPVRIGTPPEVTVLTLRALPEISAIEEG